MPYVETAAALALAHRMARLGDAEYAACRRLQDQLWPQIEVIEVDEALILRAAELTDLLALRGYDTVHCAGAEQLEDADLVVASGDKRLLRRGRHWDWPPSTPMRKTMSTDWQ
jgi:predicted nucleic acid-binding protein